MSELTGEDNRNGLVRAAEIADLYADENMRMADSLSCARWTNRMFLQVAQTAQDGREATFQVGE